MPQSVENLLADLITIPSVNPMGRTPSPETDFEQRLTLHLEKLFRGWDLPVVQQQVAPGRSNIIAWVDGDRSDGRTPPVMLWEVHQDTVPTDGMTIDPWHPMVRDGRMYGRGACDVKGSMAAMLHAFARLAAERPAGRATVVLACTVDEEAGGSGARALVDSWQDPTAERALSQPDMAVVAEPTLLDVVVAHKGVVRWKCHARGRAAHSSSPEQGDSAIYRMSRVVQALERYQAEQLRMSEAHRLLGTPSLSVGLIRGGTSVNVVPDHCVIEIDRRVLPDEDCEAAYAAAVRYVAEQTGGEGIEHERPYHASSGLSDRDNAELAVRLGEVARRHSAPGRPIGVPFGTDASHIASAGVPTVVFGPGSIQQAHTCDEWISLDQLRVAAEILHDFADPAKTRPS